MSPDDNKTYIYRCKCKAHNLSYEKHHKACMYFYNTKESLYRCPECGSKLVFVKEKVKSS